MLTKIEATRTHNEVPIVLQGGVAQMVERSLSMREVPGSIPGISIAFNSGSTPVPFQVPFPVPLQDVI